MYEYIVTGSVVAVSLYAMMVCMDVLDRKKW